MSVTICDTRLPAFIGHSIDRGAKRILSAQPAVDFTRPVGEPALAGPDSVSWRIFKNPVSLFIGGVTAVILELAEPRVRAGVWDHSSFRTDPMRRLQRTGMAAMITVYGPRAEAERMIAGVVRRHSHVTGQASTGEAYSANDVDLLDWVQATASFGFVAAYDAYVDRLAPSDIDRFYAEAAPAARLYGAVGAPTSRDGMTSLTRRMADRLEGSAALDEFLAIMRSAAIAPAPLRPLQGLLVRAAIELVPADLRARLGLGPKLGLRPWQRPVVRALAGAADRVRLDSSPAVQSCLRLGLPANHLYR